MLTKTTLFCAQGFDATINRCIPFGVGIKKVSPRTIGILLAQIT